MGENVGNIKKATTGPRAAGAKALVWLAGVIIGSGTAAQAAGTTAAAALAEQRSTVPVIERSGWAETLIDPRGEYVYPVQVTAEGRSLRSADLSLLREADGRCASVSSTAVLGGTVNDRLVVDFGIDTGGIVEVGMCDGTTTGIHLAYAERRIWLNEDGDYSGDNIGTDDDPETRTHDVAATERGRVVVPGIQGAQRWLSVSLNRPGTARVDYIRIRPTHLRVSTADNPGFGYGGQFLSSDPLLNRIWAHSAYTLSIVTLKDPLRDRYVYADGAKRDRMVWLGDVGNQGLAAYYSHRDAAKIMKATLGMFACQQYPSGYLPMLSQINVACADDYSDLTPDGPNPTVFNFQEEAGRIGEYTAWWVIGLADYYQYTGDRAFAEAMLPVARRTVDYFESRSNRGLYCTGQIGSDTPPPTIIARLGKAGEALANLLNTFSKVGMATGLCLPLYAFEINWHPFDLAFGEDMHTNAVIYRAYRRLADLERQIGQGDVAANRIAQLAETRRAAMLDTFWDESAGAFKGNSQNPRLNHTQDANIEAVLSGVVTGAQAARVMRFVDTRLQGTYGTLTGELEIDPFMEQLHAPFVGSRELVARLARHDTAGALNQMRRLWGHMTVADPASTVWERVSKSGEIPAYNISLDYGGRPSLRRPDAGFTSAAHGWGTGPLNATTGYLVGIRPLTPGFASWEVEPQPGDLTWAQGQVTTPRGVIAARWTREDGGFRLTVTAPAGSQGRVSVPLLGANRIIAMNGRVVWTGVAAAPGVNATRNGDYIVIDGLGGGSKTFAW